MKKRLAELVYRRRCLLAAIEAQRMEVANIAERCQKPIARLDILLKVWCLLRQHPALLVGGLSALLALRRTGIFGFAQTGGRLLLLYPSVIFFAIKIFSRAAKSPEEDNKKA